MSGFFNCDLGWKIYLLVFYKTYSKKNQKVYLDLIYLFILFDIYNKTLYNRHY